MIYLRRFRVDHSETINGEGVTILELRNVTKSFPGVNALDNVSIEFKAGEIHALLGENGAGKSTLIKILSGYQKADKGSEILLHNEAYRVNNTREAIEKGIQTVYQELQVIPQASVAENIMLDKLSTRGKTGILNWHEMNRVANTLSGKNRAKNRSIDCNQPVKYRPETTGRHCQSDRF